MMPVTLTPLQAARERVSKMADAVGVPTAKYLNDRRKAKTLDQLRTEIFECCEGVQEGKIKAKSPAELDARLAGLVDTFMGRSGFLLQAMQAAQREAANLKAEANSMWEKIPAKGYAQRLAALERIEAVQADATAWLELGAVMADLHKSETAMRAAGIDITEAEAVHMPLRQAIATHRYEQVRAAPKQLADHTKGRAIVGRAL
jgi:hypothetical protein